MTDGFWKRIPKRWSRKSKRPFTVRYSINLRNTEKSIIRRRTKRSRRRVSRKKIRKIRRSRVVEEVERGRKRIEWLEAELEK